MIKRTFVFCLLLLLCNSLAFATISGAQAIEIRPTVGASTNGGGFVTGATGTDMSQFNNKNAAACSSCQSSTVNISVTDGVTAGTTTITSATANFSSAIVGNVIYVSGGTGSITAARYQVVTFTNVTTIVVDRSTGLTAGTGVTVNIGGAVDDISTALLFNTTGNILFIKDTGTLVRTASLALNNNIQPQPTTPANRIIGYVTTRNEAPSSSKRAHLQLSTNSGLTALGSGTAAGWWIQNLDIDCNNLTTSIGMTTWIYWQVMNVKVSNCRNTFIDANANINAYFGDNELSGNGNSCVIGLNAAANNGTVVFRNYIHGLACQGAAVGTGTTYVENIIANNTGSTTDGLAGNAAAVSLYGNIFYKNGRCGINLNSNGPSQPTHARNNIIYGNGTGGGSGRWGWCNSTAATAAMPTWDGNAYGANTDGNRQNMDDVGGTNAINAAAPYTNTLDVALGSTDPFVDGANGNFTLTAAALLLLRGTGTPGTIPGATGTGYKTFGPFQSQVTSGGGNSAYSQ